MSSNEKQQGQQPYFPPPPPGPPPAQASHSQIPQHPNETPLPDYTIPTYDPANPQFAPPPTAGDNLYDASPTGERPPAFPGSSGKQDSGGEQGGKKKANRLSGFGAAFASKVAGPVNALVNKFGSEGFLPESLDKECEKAARILRSFCKDGIYGDAVPATAPSTTDAKPTGDGTKPKKPRVLLTIPSKVIARAQGLAIFTAVRVGFQATGSSGSGVLIARRPDGSWSPPSGIQITSIGAGFVAGLDIYDCVIVINTREALDLFTRTRLSLGSDLAVTAGPFGAGGALDWGVPAGGQGGDKGKGKGKDGEQQQHGANLAPPPLTPDLTQFQTPPVGPDDEDAEEGAARTKKRRGTSPFREAIKKPVYSYVKARGFYAGVQIDGTVITEREGANARFYGQPVPVGKILNGEVPAQGPPGMWPAGAKTLFDVLKGAEGRWGQPDRPATPIVNPATYTSAAAAAAAAPAANVGAQPQAWGPDVATGMRNLDIGSGGGGGGSSSAVSTAGPSSSSSSTVPPPPPPPPAPESSQPSAAALAKAAEAAAEAAHAQPDDYPPPPSYSEPPGGAEEDLPPAYDEHEGPRLATGDSKTGLH